MRIGTIIGWVSLAGALATVGACAISFPDYPEGASTSETPTSTGSGGLGGAGVSGGSVVGCMPPCTGVETCCDGTCVNTATDPANCNMCGITCNVAEGEICATGGAPSPTCANVDWARWPMPNGAGDVAGGAPHPMGYTDNADGTVTDMVTGLMWQKEVNAMEYTWAEAKTYCSITLSNLALGGHLDWRLPSRIELVSLVDHDIASPGPTIDAAFFPNTPPEAYWSAMPVAVAPSYAWYVAFNYGYTDYYDVTYTNRVRCVR